MDIDRDISIEDEKRIFISLVSYLSSSQYNGTLSNLGLPNTTKWIPLEALQKFNKLSQYSIESISKAIIRFNSNIFQLNSEQTSVARLVPFDDNQVLQDFQSHLSKFKIYVYGFEAGVAAAEVELYFKQQFVQVKDIQKHDKFLEVLVETSEDIVRALKMNHVFEDSTLHFRIEAASGYKDSKVRDNYRLIEFRIEFPLDDVSALADLKQQFEKFGGVHSIHYESPALFGLVKMRKGVAADVIASAAHQGGIFVQGQILKLKSMSSMEENIINQAGMFSKSTIVSKLFERKKLNLQTMKNCGVRKKRVVGMKRKKTLQKSTIGDMMNALANL